MTKLLVDDEQLTFAIPKKGRLFEQVNALLLGAGLEYIRPSRVDIANCTHFPVRLVFLPASDIATYVAEGRVDLGITGQDIIAEHQAFHVDELELLGFGKCRLGVQAPVGQHVTPDSLLGKRVVTSFPHIAKTYFQELERVSLSTQDPAQDDLSSYGTRAATPTTTKITYVSGSVEAACGLGLADGVVDLVETGTTMKAAGLELISVIMNTQAVLIANPHSSNHHRELARIIHQRIRGYLTARKFCMVSYNIHRDRLAEAETITPGRKSPTITQLAETMGNYVAVSAMLLRREAASTMDRLVDISATDIVIVNIENCRV